MRIGLKIEKVFLRMRVKHNIGWWKSGRGRREAIEEEGGGGVGKVEEVGEEER